MTISGGFIGNTLDGENTASAGLAASSEANCFILDNIIYDCTVGVDIGANPVLPGLFYGYNLMNSNGTDYDTSALPDLVGYGDVSGAPAFTDEAGDDYTLGDGSAAIDTGIQPGGIT